MQQQHRMVKKRVVADGKNIDLGSLISDSVVQSWMERVNQRSNAAFSFCAYKPASKSASDRNLVAITEASSTSAPGKKIGFSKCGTLFSANFTTADLSSLVTRMKDKEPQLYLKICALLEPAAEDVDTSIQVVSPNSHRHQTRFVTQQEGNNKHHTYYVVF